MTLFNMFRSQTDRIIKLSEIRDYQNYRIHTALPINHSINNFLQKNIMQFHNTK